MPDQVFSGKYVVQEQLASGGMGVVYKALDRTLNRLVAIKAVHEHLSGDASFTDRFIREARAMARLHHENIVTIFSVEEDRDTYFIVMEYFPGMDLRAKLKTRKILPLDESLDIALQIANGLAFAHSQGIVHRDIKPGNILLDTRGRVKLTDFGIAAALDEASITSPGQIIGTPEYMSPEQASGLEMSGQTDLYSLGIVLYEMIVGHSPFHNMSKSTILTKLIDPHHEIQVAFPAHIPCNVKAIVEDLVRRDPDYRTPRAAILVGQLKECLSSMPVQETNETPTIVAFTPTHAGRLTRENATSPHHEPSTFSSHQNAHSDATSFSQPVVRPRSPTFAGKITVDEATDILPSAKPSLQTIPSQSAPSRPRFRIVPYALATVAVLFTVAGLALHWPFSDWSAALRPRDSATASEPTPKIVTQLAVNAIGQAVLPQASATDDIQQEVRSTLQVQLNKEQEQLAIDQARVEAKRREAEALQNRAKEQATRQAKAGEEQRKRAEESARTARLRQEAEQRKFAEEQKRLEKEKQLAIAQAQAAEEQRRKAEEDARIAREREDFEARRNKEEADMKRLQAERVRLEREREVAEEQARVAEAQRKKTEEEARLANERHEAEQRRLQAERQRIETENELAAQRAKIQEEEHRKAAEEARLFREGLEAEQRRLQVERDRLEKEKELATQKARAEAEERRKAEERTRLAQERYESEQRRLQAEHDRLQKEKEVAAQRSRVEAEERRKAEEQTRLAQERYETEQKRLQSERDRAEREKEIAAQRARAEAEARRKAEEEVRVARERYETEQKHLLAERERIEKEKHEAAARQAKQQEEARTKQALGEEEQRNREKLIAKLTPGVQMSPGTSQRQLDSLVREFMRAYEDHDFMALKRMSHMDSDRLTYLDTVFGKYRSIKVRLGTLTVKEKEQEASATIIHDILIDNNGDTVVPSPIHKSFRIKILKAGDQWTKIEW
jgi:serine/threonine-protein kinase